MISPRHQFDTNYTIRARKHYFSHPYLYFVLTQIVFWLLACLIFYLIFSFQLKFISSGFYVTLPSLNLHGFTLAFIIAIFLGVFLGTVSYWLNLSWSKSRPLGIIMFAHLLFFVIVVSASFILLRFFSIRLQDFIGFEGKAHIPIKSWNFVYAQIFIYAGSVNLIISFVNQMNRKFGPGVLIPMLLGKYRYPREEVRIFMFLDLESSTKIAEQLGHIRFSKLIRETFIDINHKLSNNIAEIYQYVGDGIILSWQVTQDLEWIDTINFYYACMDRINSRKEFYMKKFGLVPVFKAGVHWGPVTAVEVGDLKRDIAYHGDTMNTTSRIQGKCRVFKSSLLISEEMEQKIDWTDDYVREMVGEVQLRGKSDSYNLFKVNRKNQ